MAVIIEFPRPQVDSTPDLEIIALLARLLERAKQGEIQSVVLIASGCDGHAECALHMDHGHAVGVIGTLRVAESRITAALEAISE